jgi:hypothetical protein
MFSEIQSGGMGALMKYMNDPKASRSDSTASSTVGMQDSDLAQGVAGHLGYT